MDFIDLRLPVLPCLQGSLVGLVLHTNTIRDEHTILTHLLVIHTLPFGESPFGADVDLLASRVLELGSPQGLNHFSCVSVPGAHGHDHLTNVHTGDRALGFAKGTTHTGLEPE